jgi:hypothetical protein
MYGTKNLKRMLKLTADIMTEASDDLKDGKISWLEGLGFVDELMQLPGVIKTWPAIKQEIGELSADEKTDLYEYAVEIFDIPNDKAEEFVEKALAWVIEGVNLWAMRKDLKK